MQQSIIEPFSCPSDLVFTKTVLIHIPPERLVNVYENLYQNALKYILIAEYYDPNPVDVEYRGYKNKLFKRDFCGELLDRYPVCWITVLHIIEIKCFPKMISTGFY